MNNLKIILSNFNKYDKKKFLIFSFLIVLLLVVELFSISLFIPLINFFFNAKVKTFEGIDFFNSLFADFSITYMIILIIITFTLKNIIFAFCSYFKKKILMSIQINFTNKIYEKILKKDYLYFAKSSNAEVLRNMSIVPSYVAFVENFINALIEILILIMIITLIYFQNKFIAYALVLSGILILLFSRVLFKERLKVYGQLYNLFQQQILNNYMNALGSIKNVLIQNKQNFFLKDLKLNLIKQGNSVVKGGFINELPRAVVELYFIVFVCAIVLYLKGIYNDNAELLANISFLVILTFKAMPSISKIIYQLNGIYYKIDIINKTHSIINNESIHKDSGKIVHTNKFDEIKKIQLKNITFGYTEDNPMIFKDFDLLIEKNQTLGIYGSSGSGKSTLVDILAGLIKPKNGNLIVNDHDLDNLNLIKNYQKYISYISQKNYILNSSIKNNIAFGEDEKKIDLQKVNEVIKMAKIKEIVDAKKQNIDFNVGDDGKNLSAGQRQRLIIARALYINSQIIIMDEATSNLDKKNESEIMKDIKLNFHHKKILIIISHDMNILDFCDKIIKI